MFEAHARDDQGGLRLSGSVCRSCATAVFPTAPVCPNCMDEAMESREMPGGGTLYSFTTLHIGPKEWSKPYSIGYIDLANGVRVFGHLVGTAHRIGAAVELTTATIGRAPDGSDITTFGFRPKEAS